MRTRLFIAVSLIVSFALAPECTGCTTFVLSDGNVILFARNFDYEFDDGIVVVNNRCLQS